MKKPLLIPGIMILLVGVAVFALPFLLGGGSDAAEFADRTSTVGGALIGIGLVFSLIILAKKSS
ncbi:hypothetical protein [Altererythrobacter sp. ZODW24]|uniref:hypothetical protein n=1 Tax=Altererythrobacter sp. ZODW24 TaxID=2185142 RepID=UPI0013B37A1B|nr:hypothetical protein [Altererythrobacter sp. ZODW24]